MDTLAPDIIRTRRQLDQATTLIDAHRHGPDTAPRVAGAHAAIEWLTGRTDIGPISGTALPVAGNVSYEAGRATMATDGYGDGTDPAYAEGVDAVLYWALDPALRALLPSWLAAPRATF